MSQIDQVVDKLLNDRYMTPAKIKAFSYVIQALKGQVVSEPNQNTEKENEQELIEDNPPNFSEIEGIQVEGLPREKVKIYKS